MKGPPGVTAAGGRLASDQLLFEIGSLRLTESYGISQFIEIADFSLA
jgi:hypothetical protein